MSDHRFDRRFLSFGLGFPWAVALCFAVLALLFRSAVPDPLGIHWDGEHADLTLSFPVFVLLSALCIGTLGSICGVLAGLRLSRRWLRRLLMGLAVSLSLLPASFAAALLIGQRGHSTAEDGAADSVVFALGSGAALALGVIMIFVYQPLPQWTDRDDRALAAEQAALAGEGELSYWLSARSSTFVMLAMLVFLLGGLLLILSPWWSLLLLILVLFLAVNLFARVSIDIDGASREAGRVSRLLRVRIAGLLPVLSFRLSELSTLESASIGLWEEGGPGLRMHAGQAQFVVRDGAALRLDFGTSGSLLLGVPDQQRAMDLLENLRRSRQKPQEEADS
ncbi:hypothetical protein [Psychromicrobium sp. YIM B11713]|uniref:hypothetical protein n=1 Tax=Psychromicrobium sp. YIM B11713 TaxID=3145233 RepID=UPI00374E8BA3